METTKHSGRTSCSEPCRKALFSSPTGVRPVSIGGGLTISLSSHMTPREVSAPPGPRTALEALTLGNGADTGE